MDLHIVTPRVVIAISSAVGGERGGEGEEQPTVTPEGQHLQHGHAV